MIRFSIRRPIAGLMMLLTLVVFGLYTYQMIAVDLTPKIDLPIAAVIIVYPGAGPIDVENSVVKEVEKQFGTLEGLKRQTSTAMEGFAFWILEYDIDKNIDFAALDIRDKLDALRDDLPEGIQDPVIYKVDLNAQPILRLAVTLPENSDLADVRRRVEDEIAPQLARVSGVGSADVRGGLIREIQIETDPSELEARGISLATIFQMVGASNLNYPLGTIKGEQSETIVRLDGEYSTVEELGNIYIPTAAGTLLLKDIARINDGVEEQERRTWYNGRETVGISVSKRSEANIVKTAALVQREVEKIRENLPDGWDLVVVVNEAKFIEDSVAGIYKDIIIGIILTSLLLIFFLRNFATTIIAAVSMPVSLLSTFTLIYAAGFSINMMTLMALGLAVGLLVTNSIVVLENIIKHLEIKGDDPAKAAERGTTEVAMAVSASMLTNVAVFVPLAFMKSTMGLMFREFGLTMVFATGMSLLISFTLTPLLASVILKQRKKKDLVDEETNKNFVSVLTRAYGRLLIKKVLTPLGLLTATLVTVAMLVSAGIIFTTRDTDFLPKTDEGKIDVSLEMPIGTTLDVTDQAAFALGERIRKLPDVNKVFIISGGSGGFSKQTNQANLNVEIKPKKERTMGMAEHLAKIREMAAIIPDAETTVTASSQNSHDASDMQVQLIGTDLDDLLAYADYATELLSKNPGVANVKSSWKLGAPELVLVPDEATLAEYGMTVGQVAQLLNLYMTGSEASVLRQGEQEISIVVRFDEQLRTSVEEVLSLPIPTPRGQVPISALVHAEEQKGPTALSRLDKQRLISLETYFFSDVPLGAVQGDFIKQMKNAPDKRDSWYRFGGSAEAMEEGQTDMLMAMVIAILLTYILLAAMLESFWQPLVIMMTIPLGAIGVAWSLQVAQMSISIMAMMAMVMLIGVVVNNAILILDYSNWLRKHRGLGWRDAVHEGARNKFRAVLMTNIASVAAMLPLALGMSEGAELRQPMAVASIGGLLVSSLMTLFLIPALYWAIPTVSQKIKNRLFRKKVKA